MLYNTQDMLWRRKLEEQADLQQAIQLQNRRLMGLQLLDVKRNSHHRTLSTGAVVSSPTYSPTTFYNQNFVIPSNRSSPEAKEGCLKDLWFFSSIPDFVDLLLSRFQWMNWSCSLQKMGQLGVIKRCCSPMGMWWRKIKIFHPRKKIAMAKIAHPKKVIYMEGIN